MGNFALLQSAINIQHLPWLLIPDTLFTGLAYSLPKSLFVSDWLWLSYPAFWGLTAGMENTFSLMERELRYLVPRMKQVGKVIISTPSRNSNLSWCDWSSRTCTNQILLVKTQGIVSASFSHACWDFFSTSKRLAMPPLNLFFLKDVSPLPLVRFVKKLQVQNFTSLQKIA